MTTSQNSVRGTTLSVLLNILRGVVVEIPADRLIMDRVHKGDSHCVLGFCHRDPRKIVRRLPERLRHHLDYGDYRLLFGLDAHIRERGGSIKAKVLANIDRLIEGEPPISYKSNEWAAACGPSESPARDTRWWHRLRPF